MPLYDYLVNNVFNPGTILGAVLYALLFIIITWILGKFFNVAVHRYLNRAQARGMDSTSFRFFGQLATAIIYIIAFIFYTRLIPPLRSLGTTWLASVSIISLVIGLAMQGTLSNLVAGISLILYRPFRIGDRIQVITPAGPEIGTVESVDLAYTSLRTSDGRRVVLPNSVIINQTNINFSGNSARVLLEIPLNLPDGGDIEKTRQILMSTAKTIPQITKINGCFVTSISTAKGTIIMLSVMCMDPGDIAKIKSDLLEAAKKQFDAAGIKII